MSKGCIFCEIIRGDKPVEFVYRGDSVVAFNDINPKAPVHILVVPQKHIRSINDLTEADRDVVAELTFRAKEIAKDQGIARTGYRLTFNVERGGGQIVFHLHMHLVGWK